MYTLSHVRNDAPADGCNGKDEKHLRAATLQTVQRQGVCVCVRKIMYMPYIFVYMLVLAHATPMYNSLTRSLLYMHHTHTHTLNC